MIEDQPSDEELTAGRIKKKKLAEGEDSHANVSTTAMVVNALTPDDNNHYFQQQYSNKRDDGAKWSSQVKNKEIVVDSKGSLRWRRRKRKQRRRKWC